MTWLLVFGFLATFCVGLWIGPFLQTWRAVRRMTLRKKDLDHYASTLAMMRKLNADGSEESDAEFRERITKMLKCR